MCFKNLFEGKSHSEQLHAIESFLSLFAHIRMIVVKNGYIYQSGTGALDLRV